VTHKLVVAEEMVMDLIDEICLKEASASLTCTKCGHSEEVKTDSPVTPKNRTVIIIPLE
jgi:hypothetical protein